MAVTDLTGDAAAIALLQESFNAQKAAFLNDPCPTAAERRERVLAVADQVVKNRMGIREAMSSDFAVHPELFSDMVEVLGMAGRAQHAAENLELWMAPEPRFVDPAMYGSARAEVRLEPKGVIGNIVPWNFPFDLGMGPLIDALAAGNRMIIKPSEFTPACAEIMRDMMRAAFDRDLVDVAVGELELAKTFPTLRWDHLLYTGSTRVGREVAKAAAENLVPVTLELGGKCPAIVGSDAVDSTTVGNIVGVKMIKNGQMCTSVDYCLVPREQVGDFVQLARDYVAGTTPGYSASGDCPGIISNRHVDRLVGLLDEAREAGCQVVQLDQEGALNRATRQMPLSIVVDPPEELGVMQEEIFGPILAVRPYDSLEEAIDYVNSRERPLGLYVMSHEEKVAEEVLSRTSSGGAAVNGCAMQGAMPSLCFGGVGHSGTGRHHGVDGFREFSNPRGVFFRGDGDLIDTFVPPYGERQQAMVDGALGGG
jgi:coniferyl-aldehyde dehydrogenase